MLAGPHAHLPRVVHVSADGQPLVPRGGPAEDRVVWEVVFVRLAERCRLLEIDVARLVRLLDALHRLLLREVRRGTQATVDGLLARVGERVAVHELTVHAAPEDGGPIEGDDVQIMRGILRLEEVFG